MLESAPSILLRFEGLAVFVGAAGLYADGDYGWLAFLVFLLAPDLGMLGYLANPRVGAATYDVVHTTVLPIALGVAGFLADAALPVQVALIWLAHIGLDRALGYGLKYPTQFKDTHLQRV